MLVRYLYIDRKISVDTDRLGSRLDQSMDRLSGFDSRRSQGFIHSWRSNNVLVHTSSIPVVNGCLYSRTKERELCSRLRACEINSRYPVVSVKVTATQWHAYAGAWGSETEVQFQPVRNFGIRRWWVVKRAGCFTPRERPGTHCTGGWM